MLRSADLWLSDISGSIAGSALKAAGLVCKWWVDSCSRDGRGWFWAVPTKVMRPALADTCAPANFAADKAVAASFPAL